MCIRDSVKLDYNAQRNYHYKLTLRFNGYANDVDWHIDYKKEDRKIQNPNPCLLYTSRCV